MRLPDLVRSIGLIYGLFGLGALLGLLHIFSAIGMSATQDRAITHNERLAFLTFGSIDGLGALLGFLVMYGFLRLRRWARYALMASGLLGLGLGLPEAFRLLVFGSARTPLVGVGLIVGLSSLAFIVSVTPAVRRIMNG